MNIRTYAEELGTNNFWAIAVAIVFVLAGQKQYFSEDDWREEARKQQMPPDLMARYSQKVFQSFAEEGYLRDTGERVTSKRIPGRKLVVWEWITQ